jgi:branched-chain amino acid transport system ATP-binding protein
MSFLIGKDMTGGYGGADILNDCTIAVERGSGQSKIITL